MNSHCCEQQLTGQPVVGRGQHRSDGDPEGLVDVRDEAEKCTSKDMASVPGPFCTAPF